MQLKFIFDQLRYGELQQVKISGNSNETGITPDVYPAIVSHINLALTELHKEFPLRRETVRVEQHEEISTYFLSSDYAVSNPDATGTQYVIDTESDPFNDNLVLIDAVLDENGAPYTLNVEDDCESLTTPIYNALNVPNPVNDNTMIVKYRANHPLLDPATTTEATIIQIPATLLTCLLLFIKHRIYAAIPSLESIQMSQTIYQQYLMNVQLIKDAGLVHAETSTNDKVSKNLWV